MGIGRRVRLGVAGLATLLVAGLASLGPGSAPAAPYTAPEARVRTLAPGRLLVASRQVTGPFFGQSVVLLLDYSAEGALGLVLNRPTRVPLSTVLPDETGLAQREDRTWVGGPVGRDTLRLLFRGDAEGEDVERVVGEIRSTVSLEVLRRLIAAGTPASDLRAYVGYAGWGPRQLDSEVMRGDWYVDRGSAEWVFERDPASMWRELLDRHEGTRTRAPAPQRTATM